MGEANSVTLPTVTAPNQPRGKNTEPELLKAHIPGARVPAPEALGCGKTWTLPAAQHFLAPGC